MVHITEYFWVDYFIGCHVIGCNEYSLTCIVIPNAKIRLSYPDRLIFVMEIPSDKDGLLLKGGPGSLLELD